MRKRDINFLERIVVHNTFECQNLLERLLLYFILYDRCKNTYYTQIIKYFIRDRKELDISQITFELNLSESGYYRKLDEIKRVIIEVIGINNSIELETILFG